MSQISALFYLYRKSFKNRVKKALRKPIAYVYLVIAVVYFIFIFGTFGRLLDGVKTDKNSFFTACLTIFVFIFIPANLISYSKRKGLVFRQSDVHFLFPASISPKKILLYAHIKMIFLALVGSIVISIGGVLWFDIPVWKMLTYFLFSCGVENMLEGSLMVLCYGNERLSKKQMFGVQLVMYTIIGLFAAAAIGVYINEGSSMSAVINYLHSPFIQLIPIIGWYIAFLHLLFMGASTVSIIGSSLFFLAVIVLFIMAVRMKCTGEYYEDAMSFAEDYEVAKAKGKNGELAVVGWKKKYGKAAVSYKGGYAKALFYRQLLEYKKSRFFIFGFYTLLCLALGIGLAVLGYRGEFDGFAPFVILGTMAYLTFIFASYAGKWGKELTKPYTYLIPDTAFSKLWYATLIEHIRALADGCLITLPAGIVLGLPLIQIVLIIAVYVCMQACKLYAEVMVEAFMGNVLGSVGKQFARLFFEGLAIGIGITAALTGTLIFSVEIGLLFLVIAVAFVTLGMMAVAAFNFERMETAE